MVRLVTTIGNKLAVHARFNRHGTLRQNLSKIIILFAIVLVMPRPSAIAEDNAALYPDTPPPEGFQWNTFSEVSVSILGPIDWHVHQVSGKNTFTGCVSKESIKERGSYVTGLTMQVLQDVLKAAKMPPSVLAVSIAEGIQSKPANKVLMATPQQQNGEISTFVLRYRNEAGVAKPIIVHNFFVAKDKSDCLYIFTFESPADKWDESWKIGNQIFQKLMIPVTAPSPND